MKESGSCDEWTLKSPWSKTIVYSGYIYMPAASCRLRVFVELVSIYCNVYFDDIVYVAPSKRDNTICHRNGNTGMVSLRVCRYSCTSRQILREAGVVSLLCG